MLKEKSEILDKYYKKNIIEITSTAMDTPEAKNIYALSYFGLLRNGYEYSTRQEIVEETIEERMERELAASKTKSKRSKNDDKNKEQDQPDEEPVIKYQNVLTMKINERGYSISESELQARYGDMYDAVINRNTKSKNRKKKASVNQIYMPEVKFEEEEEVLIERKTEEKENVVINTEPTIPFIEFDNRFPSDGTGSKSYDSFLFNQHNIKVTFADRSEKEYTAVVYPVYTNTADCIITDILAIIYDEENAVRVGMSPIGDDEQKSVTLSFDEVTFTIRGNWEDDRFYSTVNITKTSDNKPAKIESADNRFVPTYRTSSYYMRHKGNDGTYLNVFPLTYLRNDGSSGLAPAVLMVEDGKERKLFTSEGNTRFSMFYDNSQKTIGVYWAGNDLHLLMEDEL